jgi:hypothetical protein
MLKAHWNESRVSDIAGFSPDETPEDAGSRRRRVSVYEGACGCPHKTNWSVLTAARAPTLCLSTVVILVHERVEVHVPFSGTIFDHYSAMYDFHTLTWALTFPQVSWKTLLRPKVMHHAHCDSTWMAWLDRVLRGRCGVCGRARGLIHEL